MDVLHHCLGVFDGNLVGEGYFLGFLPANVTTIECGYLLVLEPVEHPLLTMAVLEIAGEVTDSGLDVWVLPAISNVFVDNSKKEIWHRFSFLPQRGGYLLFLI